MEPIGPEDPLYKAMVAAFTAAGGHLERGGPSIAVPALDGGADWGLCLPMFEPGPMLMRLGKDDTGASVIQSVRLRAEPR